MPTPAEHKTAQARILEYAEAIEWTVVSREEAEQRRGFDPEVPPADRARNRSLFYSEKVKRRLKGYLSTPDSFYLNRDRSDPDFLFHY